jgi:hypothetical protein
MISYGLINTFQVGDFVRAVCDVLPGSDKDLAVMLMLETAAAETQYGTMVDPTARGAGRGLFQCDDLPFYDTVRRTPPVILARIRVAFGIDLTKVEPKDLDYSPLLSAIICRLFYLLRPGSIPATIEERAAYWKKFYNTRLGRGTIEHYLTSAKRHVKA